MFLRSLVILAAMAGAAAAQYQSIPNFTGIGAGFNFRQAINQRFSGAQPIAPQFAGLIFASLPAEQDGLLLWCKDCQATAPCSAGGAGAWAKGARGGWSCAYARSRFLGGHHRLRRRRVLRDPELIDNKVGQR